MFRLGFHLGKMWFATGISCPEWMVSSIQVAFWYAWLKYQLKNELETVT